MSNLKTVSREYAKNEFTIVGLTLIIYSLLALYVPYLLNLLLSELNFVSFNGYDLEFISSLVCLIAGTVLSFLFLRLSCKKELKSFTGKANISVGQLLIDFVVFFVLSIGSIYVTTILASILGIESGVVSSIGITFNTELMTNPFYLLAFLVITPLLEEYAFRGVLLNCLSRYGKYFAVIAVSIVYCLAHGSFIEMIPSFLMSLVLCKISLKYKSIIPTVIIHILFNILLSIIGTMPESYALYEEIIIGFLLILAIFFIISRKYHIIHVRKSNTNNKVGLMFLSTPTVTLALIIFILHTVLIMLL